MGNDLFRITKKFIKWAFRISRKAWRNVFFATTCSVMYITCPNTQWHIIVLPRNRYKPRIHLIHHRYKISDLHNIFIIEDVINPLCTGNCYQNVHGTLTTTEYQGNNSMKNCMIIILLEASNLQPHDSVLAVVKRLNRLLIVSVGLRKRCFSDVKI